MDGFLGGMAILVDPYMLLVILAGTVLGIVVGALPGISGSTTTALLLPLTITMSPIAGDRLPRRDLLRGEFRRLDHRDPGQHAGRPLGLGHGVRRLPDGASRGEAGRALGMSAVASAIGGIFSVFVLIVAAPLLARAGLSFRPAGIFRARAVRPVDGGGGRRRFAGQEPDRRRARACCSRPSGST